MKKIPLDILFGNPKRIAPVLSPDGQWITFLAPYEGVLNLWIYSLKARLEEARALTKVKNRPI
ncbi:MAG: hypothetical protein AABZ60_20970, partial [Planctomycetota bacterium]